MKVESEEYTEIRYPEKSTGIHFPSIMIIETKFRKGKGKKKNTDELLFYMTRDRYGNVKESKTEIKKEEYH